MRPTRRADPDRPIREAGATAGRSAGATRPAVARSTARSGRSDRSDRSGRSGRSGRSAGPRLPFALTARRGGGRQVAALGLASTRRAVVLALAVSALALSIAVPLRTYLQQRQQVQAVEQQQRDLAAQVGQLEHRKAQLSDPDQAGVEARKQLGYVPAGETPYVVVLPTPTATPADTAPAEAGLPWYTKLWRAVAGAPAQ
jgi:cell division protein FtsB